MYSKLNLTGSIVDADISGTAAITRSKIAAGTVAQVVINDPTTGLLSSEANLAVSRGGTGVGTLPIGQVVVGAGTSPVTSLAVASANTASAIVQRDSGGAVAVGALTATSISTSGSTQLSGLSTGIVHSDASGNLTSSTIVNIDVSASAAIAYSKLNLTSSIVNGDISATAAIVYSKLNLTTSIVNGDISTGAAIAYSKLNLTGNIVNTDISALAAIDRAKIANGIAGQVVYNDNVTGLLESEANLAVSRGGTGVGTLPTGQVVVGAGTSPVTSLAVTSANTASAIVQRDGTGAISVGALTATSVTTSGTVQLSGLSTGVVHSGATGTLTSSTIVNTDVSASAAIAYSKLNLGTSIVNGDISAAAGIVYSKLSLTGSILNADISASAAIAYSKLNLTTSIVNGDISTIAAIAYSKLNLTGNIVNADISASAAIARIKIAAGTVAQVVINDPITGLLSSEANLAVSRGGTGVGTLPTGQAIIGAGTSAVTSLAVASINTASAIVQRDGTGAIAVGPLTATTITASSTVTLSALSTGIIHSGATGILTSTTIVNADVSATAAIAYSKLNLTTSIVNGDISTSAAIAYSKLNLTTSIVNGDISTSAAIAYSKLNLTGSIVDADISASAAITRSKIAAGTVAQVVINDPTTGLLSSEANLAVSRGGTGVGTLPTGQVVIGAGTSAVTSLAVASANTASAIVQRDGAGAVAVGALTTTTITASGVAQLLAGVESGMLQYSTGTITQSGTGVTGSGTVFTVPMTGGVLFPYGYNPGVIATFGSTTTLTMDVSQTIPAGTSYTIFYTLGNGFGLTTNGLLYLRTACPTGTGSTGIMLQLVPGGGSSNYNIDVQTSTGSITSGNGRIQFSDNNYGADYSYWSKIQGADAHALQQLFRISASGTVVTLNQHRKCEIYRHVSIICSINGNHTQ